MDFNCKLTWKHNIQKQITPALKDYNEYELKTSPTIDEQLGQELEGIGQAF